VEVSLAVSVTAIPLQGRKVISSAIRVSKVRVMRREYEE